MEERIKDAVLGCLNLLKSGHHEEAVRQMDDLVAEVIKEDEESSWVCVFINQAAILNARGGPHHSLLKRYYEQYLTHSPENPRALYGLADVAMTEGQFDLAEQYAKRCHRSISLSKDARVKKDLLDLVLERWPQGY